LQALEYRSPSDALILKDGASFWFARSARAALADSHCGWYFVFVRMLLFVDEYTRLPIYWKKEIATAEGLLFQGRWKFACSRHSGENGC
jgi:hypothetical protein